MFKTPRRPHAIQRAKLRLHGETIAHLTIRQLHAVVGGERDTMKQCTDSCASCEEVCPVSQAGACDPKSVVCPAG
jgi:hypothetical protein